MATSTDALVSLDQYLNTSYEPDMEFVDGLLTRRNVGTPFHSALQNAIGGYFRQFRRTLRIKPLVECRLQTLTGKYRIPDVMLVELPYAGVKAVTVVPGVVIEIKSPEDRFDEILDKCMEYQALGVPNILVLDPDRRRSYVFANTSLQLVKSPILLHFPKGGHTVELPIDEMFAEMDDSDLSRD